MKIISLLTIIALLTSCASYRAQNLRQLTTQSAHFTEQKQGITVSSKAFNRQDCKRYLDRDVIAKGFQPIQLWIENNTNNFVILSKNNISLPCADPELVARRVHTSTVGRVTAYGIGSLFLWPLVIPAVVDGINSCEANEELDIDFDGKSAIEEIIPPHGYLNALIFVPVESFQENFALSLLDKESHLPIDFHLKAIRN